MAPLGPYFGALDDQEYDFYNRKQISTVPQFAFLNTFIALSMVLASLPMAAYTLPLVAVALLVL